MSDATTSGITPYEDDYREQSGRSPQDPQDAAHVGFTEPQADTRFGKPSRFGAAQASSALNSYPLLGFGYYAHPYCRNNACSYILSIDS